jgi:hypothetical protein
MFGDPKDKRNLIEATPESLKRNSSGLYTPANLFNNLVRYVRELKTSDENTSEGGGAAGMVYEALISQSGTNAPTVVSLDANNQIAPFANTTGAIITFSYYGWGNYAINSDLPIFKDNKWHFEQGAGNEYTLASLWVYRINDNTLRMETWDLASIDSYGLRQINNLLDRQFIRLTTRP